MLLQPSGDREEAGQNRIQKVESRKQKDDDAIMATPATVLSTFCFLNSAFMLGGTAEPCDTRAIIRPSATAQST